MLRKLFLLIFCLTAVVWAQETPQADEKGNYAINIAPVNGKAQPGQQAGGLWRVVAENVDCREQPDSKSKVVKSFKKGTLLQADCGMGGSDEVLRNASDAEGNTWMRCRDAAGNNLDCYVRANSKYINPVMTSQEMAAPPVAANKPKKPRKAMADIGEAVRVDEPGTKSLRPYVIQLESCMRWEGMEDAWAARRDAWAKEVLAAPKVTNLGPLVAELEQHTKWDAIDPNWDKGREAWLKKVTAARTRKALGDLLMQFEGALKWETMQDDWSSARDGWNENVVEAGQR